MVNVAELQATLSLLYAQVGQALKAVESMARKSGKVIEESLGKRPTSSMKGIGRVFEDALGAKPQTAIEETRRRFTKLVWTAESGVKAISRVVTGILIAQTFYRLINAMREAISNTYQFMVNMEQAYLALELLLDSVRGAEIFLRRLETFAALTPFEMGDVVTGTRRLMGFGFAASEVLPVLEAVADACAIIGVSPAQLEDLTRAIGKIKATGRMTAREIRAFGAAGIPIFAILMEELDLTREQIRNIGEEAKGAANIVIPAILRGLEARFGGAAERLARTVGGLLSTIHDNLLLIAKDVFGGLYETYRAFLGRIVDRLNELRDILVKYGVGGLFEAIVPPQYQEAVRTMAAALLSVGRALVEIWRNLQPVRAAFLEVFVRILSVVIPTLNVLATMIEKLTRWIFQNDTIMRRWAISITVAASAMTSLLVIQTVITAVKRLAIAMGLTAAATSKWTIAITILIAALTYFLLQIPKVREWIERAFNSIAKFMGLDTESILRPLEEIDEAMPDEEAFHVVSEGVAEIAEETKKAEKALDKFLLAFDEVYAIPEKAEKMPELEMPELEEEFPVEEWWGKLQDEVEETLEDITEEVESFWDKLWEWLKNFFKAWWNLLKETALAYAQLFKDLAIATWNFIRDMWRAWVQLFKDLWNALKQFAKDVWGALAQLVKDLWNALVTFAKGIWGAFSQLFKDLWNAIKEFATGIWDAITQLVKDLWGALVTLVKGLWEAIKQLWRDLLSAETLRDVLEAFGTFFATVGGLFTEWFSTVKEAFANFFTTIHDLAVQFGESIRTAFSNFFTTIHNLAVQFGESIWTAFSNFFTRIHDATVAFTERVKEAFLDFFTRIGEAIISYAERIGEIFKAFFTRILNTVETYVAALLGGLWDRIMQGIRIEEFFNMLNRQMKAGIDALVRLIVSSVTAAISLITERIPAALARVRQFLVDLGNAVLAKFNAVISSIGSAIDRVIRAVTAAINTIISLINKIPGVNIPTIPYATKVPGMQYGGILRKEQLVKAGERPEAYTPLTAEALKPWAEAIASALGGAGRGAPAAEAGYVAIPIDYRGKVDLERELFVIRKREVVRGVK